MKKLKDYKTGELFDEVAERCAKDGFFAGIFCEKASRGGFTTVIHVGHKYANVGAVTDLLRRVSQPLEGGDVES